MYLDAPRIWEYWTAQTPWRVPPTSSLCYLRRMEAVCDRCPLTSRFSGPNTSGCKVQVQFVFHPKGEDRDCSSAADSKTGIDHGYSPTNDTFNCTHNIPRSIALLLYWCHCPLTCRPLFWKTLSQLCFGDATRVICLGPAFHCLCCSSSEIPSNFTPHQTMFCRKAIFR